jgi:AraC-like DNA-binding protein
MPDVPIAPPSFDPLSDICTASGLQCTQVERWDLASPWGVRFGPSPHAMLHTLVRGRAVIVAGADPKPIEETGAAILPRGVAHVVASRWPLADEHVFDVRPAPLSTGAVVCYRPSPNPDTILLSMPFAVPGREIDEPATDAVSLETPVEVLSHPSEDLVELAVLAAKLALDPTKGARYIACRVGEALLAKSLQRMAGRDSDTLGLFGLFASVGMRTALEAIERDVGHAWTIGELAELAHLPRARFRAEFVDLVGIDVRDFVDLRRIRHAERAVQAGIDLGELATRVGFRSRTAFERALRRVGALRPGRLRAASSDG